tara:strand:- start:133 stop:555 length:423 start_codon:yes stop_codon:yes gene_type:complete
MTTRSAELVSSKDLPYVWVYAKPLIEKALAHAEDYILVEDVLSLLLSKQEHLFIGKEDGEINSALVAEIITYPRKKALRIITWSTNSGRDLEQWIDLLDTIEEFAISNNCSSLEAWTRKGLARKLKWDNEYSIITKQIGG